jgi:creatinine amidohydrolase
MANISKLMSGKGNPVLWEELSWKDIENLTKTMNIVIVPVGACEQHGPHLPLGVDTIDCYEIAKRVSGMAGEPVVPPIMYGCSQSHRKFTGRLQQDQIW